jgi:hypothetical protein
MCLLYMMCIFVYLQPMRISQQGSSDKQHLMKLCMLFGYIYQVSMLNRQHKVCYT